MENMCIACNQKEVAVKKHKLCYACYSRAYRERKLFTGGRDKKPSLPTLNKEIAKREIEFIRNYFHHPNWVHHPGIFRMDGISYAPDFYDSETNTFIEVAGTKQAYHANKNKYDMMHKHFPKILFEVHHVNGEAVDANNRISWQNKD